MPDPNSYLRLPPGMDAIAAVQKFAALEMVAAYLVPRPMPVPVVLDYVAPGNDTGNTVVDPYQRYLDAVPKGIDARWAWDNSGGTAAGIRICDVEYDYNASHEDLPAVTLVGNPISSPYGDDHGTAVLGIWGGKHNG